MSKRVWKSVKPAKVDGRTDEEAERLLKRAQTQYLEGGTGDDAIPLEDGEISISVRKVPYALHLTAPSLDRTTSGERPVGNWQLVGYGSMELPSNRYGGGIPLLRLVCPPTLDEEGDEDPDGETAYFLCRAVESKLDAEERWENAGMQRPAGDGLTNQPITHIPLYYLWAERYGGKVAEVWIGAFNPITRRRTHDGLYMSAVAGERPYWGEVPDNAHPSVIAAEIAQYVLPRAPQTPEDHAETVAAARRAFEIASKVHLVMHERVRAAPNDPELAEKARAKKVMREKMRKVLHDALDPSKMATHAGKFVAVQDTQKGKGNALWHATAFQTRE
jgi:hypothetical protein